MQIGEKIKNYRTLNNMSQDELASKLFVSRQAITKWENNLGLPDISNIIQLSKLMGVSVDDLLKGDTDEESREIEEKFLADKKNKAKTYLACAIMYIVASVLNIIIAIIYLIINRIDMFALFTSIFFIYVVLFFIYISKYNKTIAK